MKTRIELHDELISICDHVYFQPPDTKKLVYPCIVYSLVGDNVKKADDVIYKRHKRYQIIVVDKNADSEISDKLLDKFQYCSLGLPYRADNLYHYPHTLYY